MPADKFISLIKAVAREIEEDYKGAQDHARGGDPQRAGHEGESAWKRLIGDWFPTGKTVVRKYIVGPGGDTNEVDLVVLKPDYPPHLLDQPSVLCSGVQAAFTCKLTLKRPDILEAIQQKRLINRVAGNNEALWPEAMTGPIPFGILSQSTSLCKSSTNFRNDFRLLYEEIAHSSHDREIKNPKEELDSVLIADRGFWSTIYSALMPRFPLLENGDWVPATVFLEHEPGKQLPGYPLVQFLIWMSIRLGPTAHPSLAALGPVFGLDQQSGDPTFWDMNIFPEFLREHPRLLLNEYGQPKTV